MTNRISANAVTFTNDGYSTLLGFAEDPANPQRYVMLNLTNDPDEQDFALGMTGVHIEAGDLKVDGYDLVTDLSLTQGSLIITLDSDAARAAGIDPEIEIVVKDEAIDGVPLAEAVDVFRERIAARPPTRP
ncbi:MAG TPA: Imm10 family immunity protein [Allosphingosinicella sp.]|nr:Imm10 family immunity protein [Allosphingosinicella sp.]